MIDGAMMLAGVGGREVSQKSQHSHHHPIDQSINQPPNPFDSTNRARHHCFWPACLPNARNRVRTSLSSIRRWFQLPDRLACGWGEECVVVVMGVAIDPPRQRSQPRAASCQPHRSNKRMRLVTACSRGKESLFVGCVRASCLERGAEATSGGWAVSDESSRLTTQEAPAADRSIDGGASHLSVSDKDHTRTPPGRRMASWGVAVCVVGWCGLLGGRGSVDSVPRQPAIKATRRSQQRITHHDTGIKLLARRQQGARGEARASSHGECVCVCVCVCVCGGGGCVCVCLCLCLCGPIHPPARAVCCCRARHRFQSTPPTRPLFTNNPHTTPPHALNHPPTITPRIDSTTHPHPPTPHTHPTIDSPTHH